MKDIMDYIQLSGLDIDVSELAELTDSFKKKGHSMEAAQRMAVSAKVAELKEDKRQINKAIKQALSGSFSR